ncbi:DUF3054 domain-containing protein [Natronomonas sp. F2-12]|jgi:hypothetical protein|uniref:DUF3054 domain-containing protein n=1 Tax=Natronomonas aquatica TaxID=2841590 RepID=A0A9R1CSD7_9EURY|nr:DUF3054 domain-containing protein [Natronomonas aquatica]MCQ4332958.1 DUF3054 domain-containing protein [Natronomonas aquatica]
MRLCHILQSVGSLRSAAFIAAGDVLAIVAFLAYGLATHGIDPLQFPRHTLLTAFPFVSSWLCLAPIGRLYRPRVRRSWRAAIGRTVAVWIGASLLGGAIRSTSLVPGEAPPEFLLVVIVFGIVFLLPWRSAVILAEHVRHNPHLSTGRTDRT